MCWLTLTSNNSELTPSVAMEIFADPSFRTLDLFFEKHDLPVLRDRLLLNFKGELESIHVLTDFWFDYLEGSPKKLLDFYEKVNDRRKTVHYENLIDLFLISFLAELLAAIIATEYLENRERIVKAVKELYEKSRNNLRRTAERVFEKYEHILEYLFRVYTLKEYMEKTRISHTDFLHLRERLKRVVFADTEDGKLPEEYNQFEESYLKEHSLPTPGDFYSEKLGDELLSLLDGQQKKSQSERITPSNETTITFSMKASCLAQILTGLAANPGYAAGKVKILLHEEDVLGVRKGDIIVLVDSKPDFVPALRGAGAIIADRGGMTGHSAIVGRALGLPTVVGTVEGTKTLNDGMNIFVDATHGVVYEIRS